MNEERARMLAELLKEMREQDKGWIPDAAWGEIQKTFRLPYTEILVWKEGASGECQVLLHRRKDEHWDGWEIPGKLARAGETLQMACEQTAAAELGIGIGPVTEIASFWWDDHPYGYPISHVCVCEAAGEIIESEDLAFFSNVPEPMIAHQGELASLGLRYLNSQRGRP